MHTHGTFCSLGNSADRVSHLIGWPLIRLLHVLESVATQWDTVGFHHCVVANFLWLFLLGSCPFAACFAVLGKVRRKSGRRICVLPFVGVFYVLVL
jgi:hypothetical protein